MEYADLDWKNLGFKYRETDYSYISRYIANDWDEGKVKQNRLSIDEKKLDIDYIKQCFEELKAYRSKEGDIYLFRPYENIVRLNRNCEKLLMPNIPKEKFIKALKDVVRANERFIPPYDSKASLYIRPFISEISNQSNLKIPKEYIFSIYVTPVGPTPMNLSNIIISKDRKRIDEVSNSTKSLKDKELIYINKNNKLGDINNTNLFVITKNDVFVSLKSSTGLPSITKNSLMYIAKNYLNMKVEERDIYLDEIDNFCEIGTCSTKYMIKPIKSIIYEDKEYIVQKNKIGPITNELYDILRGIQYKDIQGPKDWVIKV